MKNKHVIIIILAILGSILFGIVHGVIIPRNNERAEQYAKAQQNPTTHDLKTILKYKNAYMGNMSNTVNLFHTLPLSNLNMTFQLNSEKYLVEVNYEGSVGTLTNDYINKSIMYNSIAGFSLIENLEEIDYNFQDAKYKVKRQDIEMIYGKSLTNLLQEEIWKSKVQESLKDENYVNNFIKNIKKNN